MPSFSISESLFREAVDGSPPTVTPSLRDDLPALCKHFSLDPAEATNLIKANELLHARIRELLTSSSLGPRWREVNALHKQVLRQHLLNDITLQPYIGICDVLVEVGRILPEGKFLLPFSKTGAWKDSIQLAHDVSLIAPFPQDYSLKSLQTTKARIARCAESARWIRDQGFSSVHVENGAYAADDGDMGRIVDAIEGDICSIGGMAIIELIFSGLQTQFDSTLGRYLLGRRCSQFGTGIQPALPVGFLLNLCVKERNLGQLPSMTPLPQPAVEHLDRFAKAYAALYDVQPYSQFEVMVLRAESVLHIIQEVSIYDSLFSFTQFPPEDLSRLMVAMFRWVDRTRFKNVNRWDIDYGIRATQAIISLSKPHCPLFFVPPFLAANLSMPLASLEPILKALSHRPPAPNARFASPRKMEDADFIFRPLIAKQGGFLLANPCWCAPAFYEALMAAARKVYGNAAHDNIGPAMEQFLKSEFASHGVTHISGKYKHLGQEGECDLVVETDKTVIFFELKAKALTRIARSGYDVDLLIDISGSLVDAQLQLGRHEIVLRTQGHLDLEDASGRTTRLSLKGREIERIAVSLFDFGGIQDRQVVRQLLTLLDNAQLGADDPAAATRLASLNSKATQLRAQAIELLKLPGVNRSSLHFNCAFVSVPQLLAVLRNTHSNNELRSELWETRHMSFASLDFYFDYAQMKKIKASASPTS
jgi:hypothetical protein